MAIVCTRVFKLRKWIWFLLFSSVFCVSLFLGKKSRIYVAYLCGNRTGKTSLFDVAVKLHFNWRQLENALNILQLVYTNFGWRTKKMKHRTIFHSCLCVSGIPVGFFQVTWYFCFSRIHELRLWPRMQQAVQSNRLRCPVIRMTSTRDVFYESFIHVNHTSHSRRTHIDW